MTAFLAAGMIAVASTASAGELTIGDAAPQLVVKNWVKGEPVRSFAADGTYVVEFWATWCGPCRQSIPHLTELQKHYADDVTFIGVSVWEDDPAGVAPFVEKMGDKMAYRVATDLVDDEGNGTAAKGWLEAAGLGGIPSAFIVDGGKIAWIGHPLRMDEALQKVVAGEWDVEAAAQEYAAMRAKEAKSRAAEKRLKEAMGQEKWSEAVAIIDETVAADPAQEAYLGPQKFMALLSMKSYDDAYAYGTRLVGGVAKDNANALNWIAWAIVDPENRTLDRRDLDLALRAAERANELTEGKEPAILDTLAKVCFDRGNVERAIELQKKAVELAAGTAMESELKARLDHYMEAAKI